MKRSVFLLTLVLCAFVMMAKPVDVNTAMQLGKSFVNLNFNETNRNLNLSLAYTSRSYGNENRFYVFNVGTEGFVIISADDFYRPVIGYSENGAFDYDNIPPALKDFLDGIESGRRMHADGAEASPEVTADWESLRKTGNLVSRNGGKASEYLVTTKWNQDYPYNYCCPEDPAGPGGHVYVGCLATAMAQLMRYWCYPINGIGSHCYVDGNYGEICADFENTTYDWANMPTTLTSGSPEVEKVAVGTLGFHCGVTIDMGYGPDGSGGGSIPIVSAMPTYFGYSDSIHFYSRQDYELEPWCDMLKEHFDMGWPCYYGGCADGGCHAFVCDGYNDYDLYHFNLGWGGGSDGWYIMDTSPYTTVADAMFNFVPQYVFDATPCRPSNLVVTTMSDESLEATVQWTNPTEFLNGAQLSAIDKVIVARNGKVIYEVEDGVTPGITMTFTDRVPCYDEYDYKVYVVANGMIGKQSVRKNVHFGPTCEWRIVMTSSDYHGWNGGYISVYNMAGTEIGQFTMTSSTPQSPHVDMPIGLVRFGWTSPADTIDDISFNIRDAQNVKVYSFSGSTEELENGVFFRTNNSCGNDAECDVPSNVTAVVDGDDVNVSWDGVEDYGYGYMIFRDGKIHYLANNGITTFVDEDVEIGGHCYSVGVLCDGGWDGLTTGETCVTTGEGCDAPSDIWYTPQTNGKPVITWTAAPTTSETLSGYYVFRKVGEYGEYERVKIVSANKTEYRETKSMEAGVWYYYRVMAYYQSIDCESAPAKSKYGDEFFVKCMLSCAGIEDNDAVDVSIYPNPAKDVVIVKAGGMTSVSLYNVLGRKLFEENNISDEYHINIGNLETGIYMIKAVVNGVEVVNRISVVK